jgi:CRP-like cAMP-binding protein
MSAKNLALALQNNLLAGLPGTVFDALSPHFNTETAQSTIIAQLGDELDQVYFALSGMISILAVLQAGRRLRLRRWDAKGR